MRHRDHDLLTRPEEIEYHAVSWKAERAGRPGGRRVLLAAEPVCKDAAPSRAAKRGRMSIFDLNGRRALVTGGAKGIGAAIVRALAEAGVRVAICDLDVARRRSWRGSRRRRVRG